MACTFGDRLEREQFAVVGVGAGPANLGLAAMITELPALIDAGSTRFFHDAHDISWHSGQLLPGASMLSEFYWDLVTPVNPRSRFSFLNYLSKKRRLAAFLNAGISRVSRAEFEDYLRWVSTQLDNLTLGSKVTRIEYCSGHDLFHVTTARANRPDDYFDAHNVVVGIGAQKKRQLCSNSPSVISVTDLAFLSKDICDQKHSSVAVVGGGQSAAEAIQLLIDALPDTPRFSWVCPTFAPANINNSAFALELFIDDGISDYHAARTQGREIVGVEGLVAGVDPELSRQLLARQYTMRAIEGRQLEICRNFRVSDIRVDADDSVRLIQSTTGNELGPFDLVVIADGRASGMERALSLFSTNTRKLIDRTAVNRDYARDLGRISSRNIFFQSVNEETHSSTDSNFITAPFRNTRIISNLLGCTLDEIQSNWSY